MAMAMTTITTSQCQKLQTFSMVSEEPSPFDDKIPVSFQGKQDGHTSRQPRGVAITVCLRSTISSEQVSDNHGKLFRPCQTSSVWHSRQLPQQGFANPFKRQLRITNVVTVVGKSTAFFRLNFQPSDQMITAIGHHRRAIEDVEQSTSPEAVTCRTIQIPDASLAL